VTDRLCGKPLIRNRAATGTIYGVKPKRVVILGAGVAGLEAALALRAVAEDRVAVELVSPDDDFVYRPLAVAAPFGLGEARRFPVARLATETGASFTQASALGVEPDRNVIETSGGEIAYDVALLALGARSIAAVPGAVTFRGPQDEAALAEVLADAREGRAHRLVFTMPAGMSWPLPLYELALLTAVHLANAGADATIELVTPEPQPLQLFGSTAGQAIGELFDLHGINIVTNTIPQAARDGVLEFVGTGQVPADRVVALPRLEGPRLEGVPHDPNGFVPVDEHQRVLGHEDVFAAGDIADFPVKQGGLAAQQADVAADAIAAAAGADVDPQPFKPVLRGLLLTGLTPRFMRAEPGKSETALDTEALWWPPAKIVGRYLAPFLAERLDMSASPPPAAAVEVDVELDRGPTGTWQRI
jgi:sulfide:quinone oxidoreductase